MTVHELTPEDLAQLLTLPQDVTLLHYYSKRRPTAPALCGAMPDGGSWKSDSHYRPGNKAYTADGKLHPQFELCPGCQVRFSTLSSDSAQGGGVR